MSTIKELSNLRGRRALVTGATGNLGKVIANALAELGADLVLVVQPCADFASLTARLTERWSVAITHHFCDLELPTQRTELMEQVNKSSNGLNILVNNAAFVGTSDLTGWKVPFEQQTLSTWRRALEVNLTAVFDLCQGLTPMLRAAEGASIINIASTYGMLAPDWSLYAGTTMGNPAAYGASKGGLIQFTRWLATTLAPAVRVNCISPGGIWRNQPDDFVARYATRTPLQRMGTEDDLRGAIAYLASDLSKYVTGQNLSVDGGWGVW